MNEDTKRIYELYMGGYSETAFRLELLPRYELGYDTARWEQFISGELWPTDSPQRTEIMKKHAEVLQSGRTMSRIHVIDDLNPYIQYEIDWGYRYTASASEQIYLMHTHKYKTLVQEDLLDFWLFDDTIVVKLTYDDNYRFMSAQFCEDDKTVNEHIAIRDTLMPHAISLQDFVSALRQTTIPWPESLPK